MYDIVMQSDCRRCTKKSTDNSETVELSVWKQNTVFCWRQSRAVVSVDRLGQ